MLTFPSGLQLAQVFCVDLFTASDHCSPFFYLLRIPRLHSLLLEWGVGSKAVMVASRSPRIPRGLGSPGEEQCVYWMVGCG